ncbi:unnamed protein product [Oppiella nova]|uniref:Sugar phosphate transporter domain-containing protein n=1 Tax=Oppiella nova TaxID=334625 RepID=A0A7R9LH53_9ACAR|nr:unnamed protein product [Oppiella nova]CAG2163576.1 unnamed protein product [Oppiella nova]
MSCDDSSGLRRMSSSDKKTMSDSATPEDTIRKSHQMNGQSMEMKRQISIADNSLFSAKAIRCVVLWYIFSFTTLFLNKYIVSYEKGDTTMLGDTSLSSLSITCITNLVLFLSQSQSKPSNGHQFEIKLKNFTKNLLVVGSLRFSTIVLGLIALWFVEVSFAETVKSSAPVFTVLIARVVLGEKTSLLVNLSLIPVMSGLVLCSAFEMRFTLIGLFASLATNLSECFQNVFSKRLLNVEQYEPSHLQFYTSFSSMIVQIPCVLILVDVSHFVHSIHTEKNLLLTYILAGISFHCQSYTEYILLNLISPVTHSVANTAKRAFLIWLSVIIFGNPVTTQSWIGTAIVISGVFIYNKTRQLSSTKSTSEPHYSSLLQTETHNV